MLMEMFTYIVTGTHEVQNPANEKKGILAQLMHTYTYTSYNTLHYNIKHIITLIYYTIL